MTDQPEDKPAAQAPDAEAQAPTIYVTPSESWGGQRRQRGRHRDRDRDKESDQVKPRLAFVAVMQKPEAPDKHFTISLDRSEPPKWRCGNGFLVQEESDAEALTWEAEDGRCSKWTRPVPEGTVYFDPPPHFHAFMDPSMQVEATDSAGYGGFVMCMPGMLNPDAPEFVPFVPTPAASPALVPRPTPISRHRASPTLTPLPSPHIRPNKWGRTPTPSPMFGPLAAPMVGVHLLPSLGPAELAPPAPVIELQLSEESPDVITCGAKMEWSVPDSWGKLSRFPKDFCITSPMFGVHKAANMQLAFYPNGSRVAEPGHCTVALTRGPDSAGIKFEFLVNGRGIGPKVCLGRRYLGDYPKPFDDSEENKAQKVVVCMQVLEMLGGND